MTSRKITIDAQGVTRLDGCTVGKLHQLPGGVLRFNSETGDSITGNAWHNMRWELSVMFYTPESAILRDSAWLLGEPDGGERL